MYGDMNVDLTVKCPELVSARERMVRLAKDPVAAADFFQLQYEFLFRDLLGWDFEKSRSRPGGGLLGELAAFIGTTEFTERGSLHGHRILWLQGGLSPSELHRRLDSSTTFQGQLFNFLENIIWHELPDLEVDIPSDWDPRTERPPEPPGIRQERVSEATDGPVVEDPNVMEVVNEWDMVFVTEIKKCGVAAVAPQGTILDQKCQIHAQQATQYLHGFEDFFCSHPTVSMPSGLLMSYVKGKWNDNATQSETNDDDSGEEDACEPEAQVKRTTDGQYTCHDKRRADTEHRDTSEQRGRAGTCPCYMLHSPHPLKSSHVIVQHAPDDLLDGNWCRIPRVSGMTVPRQSNQREWALFALAHFRPFNDVHRLIEGALTNEAVINAFTEFTFQDQHQQILQNWEDVHECEDEREAERLKKQSQQLSEASKHGGSGNEIDINAGDAIDDDDDTEEVLSDHCIKSLTDSEHSTLATLYSSGWISEVQSTKICGDISGAYDQSNDDDGKLDLKTSLRIWRREQKQQEDEVSCSRRKLQSDPGNQISQVLLQDTLSGHPQQVVKQSIFDQGLLPTEARGSELGLA
ncbi:hypothetical protein NP233_g11239 [Leucocoprinus birnbaumii]|uniref:Helitron helicase-like domain-containing protein n=1 Tax=Leucocoprinus birnbaumii TaxID=56174 RepID=A0AAD5VKM3_9AGAR|nr:hypothetical protein NP233_g11239 [Leucocoprinus birnbaumii]